MRKIIAITLLSVIIYTNVFCSGNKDTIDSIAPIETTVDIEQIEINSNIINRPTEFEYTESQKAIAMLNYLMVQTQVILKSKNNRITLDEIYDNLINNLDPTAVDETTRIYLNTLLNNINEFQLIDIDREHLEILYENEMANAISKAMPDPMYIMSIALSDDILKTIASVVMTGLSTWTNMQNGKNAASIENLKAQWELDEDEIGVINELRTNAFNYLIKIANSFSDIVGDDTLSEKDVNDYVEYKSNTNIYARKQLLENNQYRFSKYGPYWGMLAQTYFEISDYKKCIEAVREYQKVRAPIFRQDSEFAMALMYAVISAESVYADDFDTYISETKNYLQLLEKETQRDDSWQMRYFIIQSYLSLASKTNDSVYLEKAFSLVKKDLVNLSLKQEKWIDDYLQPVDVTIKDNLTKTEKAKREEEIARQKEIKQTSGIPYCDAFWDYWEMYVSLADKLNVTPEERNLMKRAVHKELAIYQERYYLLENNDTQQIERYLSLLDKNGEFEPLYQDMCNIYRFRRDFDDSTIDSNPYSLISDIYLNYPAVNYYLPSLLFSNCSYSSSMLWGLWGDSKLTVNIPACLLRDETEIDVSILDLNSESIFSVTDMEYSRIFYNNANVLPFEACFDSPVFFSWVTITIPFTENLDIKRKMEYTANISLKDKKDTIVLIFNNITSEEENNYSQCYLK